MSNFSTVCIMCMSANCLTTQIYQSSNDSVLYLGDSILNLLRNTDYLQVLHAFLHSYQANSRKVGLPWLSTLFQIHYSLPSNHLMLHSLLLTMSLNKLQLNKYLQLIIFDGMCIMRDAPITCWCNLYLFICMTYTSWNNVYPIYLTLTQHFCTRGWYIRLIICAGSNTKQMDCNLFSGSCYIKMFPLYLLW